MPHGGDVTRGVRELYRPPDTDRLIVDRLPGECGPVLRCDGELTLETSSELREELQRLEPMGHPVLTIDLSGCDFIDVDGLVTLLKGYRRLLVTGRRMVLVTAGGIPSRVLQVLGIDAVIPVFPTEAAAALALRGAGSHLPAPPTWEGARQRTLERWQLIDATLAQNPEEALRLMTSMFALCDRSAELYEALGGPAPAFCHFCPLFHGLGGRRGDLGCRSVLDPIIDLVRVGDLEAARTKIGDLTRVIAEMPLPEEGQVPGSLLSADGGLNGSVHARSRGTEKPLLLEQTEIGRQMRRQQVSIRAFEEGSLVQALRRARLPGVRPGRREAGQASGTGGILEGRDVQERFRADWPAEGGNGQVDGCEGEQI